MVKDTIISKNVPLRYYNPLSKTECALYRDVTEPGFLALYEAVGNHLLLESENPTAFAKAREDLNTKGWLEGCYNSQDVRVRANREATGAGEPTTNLVAPNCLSPSLLSS